MVEHATGTGTPDGDTRPVRELLATRDWSQSPLGAPVGWSASLRSIVGTLLKAQAQIVLFWGPDYAALYNDAYAPSIGDKHPEALGRPAREHWTELWDDLEPLLHGVRDTGETFVAKDRSFYIERYGFGETVYFDVSYSAVPDDDGSVGGVLCIVSETSNRIRAEQALRASEAKLRALVTATSDMVFSMSPDWQTLQMLQGQGILEDTTSPSIEWRRQYLYEGDAAALDAAIERAIRDKAPFELEHRIRLGNGAIGWVQSRAVPILGDDGEIVEWFGTATDITARHAEREHLELVVNELNHRVKNNLAMVQAIAQQTFRDSDGDAQQRFSGRIVALAQANDLLTGERWAGASLRGAIEQAILPHVPDPARISVSGPDVQLTTKTALAFALAMHEMATNAVKYGAWSNAAGRVTIEWTYEDDRLQLTWQESGGPAIPQPTRQGFGTRLIRRGLAAEITGDVTLDFRPDGLRCMIDAVLHAPQPEGEL